MCSFRLINLKKKKNQYLHQNLYIDNWHDYNNQHFSLQVSIIIYNARAQTINEMGNSQFHIYLINRNLTDTENQHIQSETKVNQSAQTSGNTLANN